MEELINVYVEIDKDNNITKVFSSDFEQPKETSLLIDKGLGDKFRHAQNKYFDKPLINDEGGYNYKFKKSKVIEN